MTKTKIDRVAIAAEVSMNQFSDIRKYRVRFDFPLASLFEVGNGSYCSSRGKSGVKYNPPIPLAFAITIIAGKAMDFTRNRMEL
ncbi:hypothetical protein [Parapedobacter soli]|uniref:hypothetical protein n=1 Tax=Parapedobacter soli TaxID=416955 RepID=UPI0021CA9265|nr:hypothetical protein [Parapedobacter soli]